MTVLLGDNNDANFASTTLYGASNGEMAYNVTALASGTVETLYIRLATIGAATALRMTVRTAAGALLGTGTVALTGDEGVRSASVTPFDVTEGVTYKIGIAPNAGSITGYHNGVLYQLDYDSSSTYASPEATYVASTVGANKGQFQMWAEGSSGPAINPTGTDTDLVNGTSSSLVVQNTVSDPESITVIYDDGVADPISSVQADFLMGTITSGAGTATFSDTIGNLPYSDGVTYLAADYSYLVTCADDSELTLDTLTFAPATGRDFVVAVDPVSDETGILYQWESGGPVTGDQIDYQTDAVTVREDFTFFGPAGESGVTLYINYWDSVGQIRYPVAVIVAFDESGEGTVTGITSRGFTAEGFTVRGFTVRGF